jgi:hypothetical protein
MNKRRRVYSERAAYQSASDPQTEDAKMKIVQIVTAGAIALASLTAPATAQAQGRYDRYEHSDRGRGHGWRNDRGDRGHHYGQRRSNCRTEWRHHHRVRVCR